MHRFIHHAGMGLLGAALAGTVSAALAQPAPTFRATCGELRGALAGLGSRAAEELVVIDVVGELTAVEHDGTLGYMFMCDTPDPRVLCITYQVNQYRPGDRASLVGTLTVLDEDHLRLDPCLHYPPDAGTGRSPLP